MKRVRSERIPLDKLHPWKTAEALLPEYSEQQYRDLEDFLANGGQLAPLTVAEDCRIIDGYNRWRTAARLKMDEVECDVYSYDNSAEMEIHAIVLNSKRRHLNRLQIARAAARLSDLLPAGEGVFGDRHGAGIEEEIDEPGAASRGAAAEKVTTAARPDKAMRNVSHKLGILPSTVQQVSKVDKSGDERLISAMEGKRISIKQAAEIADMDEEQRSRAMETIDEENARKNSCPESFARICADCTRRLYAGGKKIRDSELSEIERDDMKASLVRLIEEANALMKILSEEKINNDDEQNG